MRSSYRRLDEGSIFEELRSWMITKWNASEEAAATGIEDFKRKYRRMLDDRDQVSSAEEETPTALLSSCKEDESLSPEREKGYVVVLGMGRSAGLVPRDAGWDGSALSKSARCLRRRLLARRSPQVTLVILGHHG